MNDAGLWSLVPPVVAIVLALLTREIVLSLVAAIVSGAIVHVTLVGGTVLEVFRMTLALIGDKMSANMPMVIFLCLLGALVLLALAWGISAVCNSMLGTGRYIASMIVNGGVPLGLMPAVLFTISATFAFTTGASWGAIGILVPIGMTVAASMSPTLAVLTLAATLSGGVMGDHCSPISDTTILSSTGAQCKHVNHVMTQLPYALVAGGVSLVLYLVLGFFM